MKIKNKLGLSPSLWICFIAVILLVCNSCTQQQVAMLKSGYHITYNMDGTTEDFSQGDTCQITKDPSSTPGTEYLSIRGHNSLFDMAHGAVIELSIVSSDSISTGTYTDSSSTGVYGLYADYIPEPFQRSTPGTNLYTAGHGVYIDGVQKGVQLSHHFTVTITSISNGTIKGTFSGDFYEYDTDISQAKIMRFTNGDFYLKIQ